MATTTLQPLGSVLRRLMPAFFTDFGRPCVVFTRNHWTETLGLREAARMLDVLELLQGRRA